MTELVSSNSDSILPSQETNEDGTALEAKINKLSEDEALRRHMHEIASSVDIVPDFFDDEANSLLFLAIAGQTIGETMDKRESAFYAFALSVIARQYSDVLHNEYYESEETFLTDDEKNKLYQKYTNNELTAELKKMVSGGAINDVVSKLKPNGESITDINVRVLNIATEDNVTGFIKSGLEDDETQRQIEKWQKSLTQNRSLLDMELRNEFMPGSLAWVEILNGEPTIFISLPDAEKIIDKSLIDEKEMGPDGHDILLSSILKHEFTHTQGGVNDELAVGIGLEELRAEEYSGSKGGYFDAKQFAKGLDDICGTDLRSVFKGLNGGDRAEVYGRIVDTYGAKLGLEIIMARPRAYKNNEKNPILVGLDTSLGSYADILERELARRINNDAEEESLIIKRMMGRRDKLKSVSSYVVDGIYSKEKNPLANKLWNAAREKIEIETI